MEIIARIENGFREKFGVPRQSGLVPEVISRVVMTEKYSVREAFRGIEDYSHLWLLWEFDRAQQDDWRPTVRPPRLGGNTRLGVFATRSPFRPNRIGLTVVRLIRMEEENGRTARQLWTLSRTCRMWTACRMPSAGSPSRPNAIA